MDKISQTVEPVSKPPLKEFTFLTVFYTLYAIVFMLITFGLFLTFYNLIPIGQIPRYAFPLAAVYFFTCIGFYNLFFSFLNLFSYFNNANKNLKFGLGQKFIFILALVFGANFGVYIAVKLVFN